MRVLLTILLSLLTLSSIYSQIEAKQSSVVFIIKNAGIKVEGSFEQHSIQLGIDGANLNTLTLKGNADVSSIDTGIGMRDRHLQKKGYFDVEKYPLISIESTSVKEIDDTSLDITFLLTLKGVEKEIAFPVTVVREGNNLLLSGSFEINRIDFEVGSNSLTLSDEVIITVEAQFEIP